MPQVCTTDLNLSISHATYYDLEVFMWVNYPVWASMGMRESCHENEMVNYITNNVMV